MQDDLQTIYQGGTIEQAHLLRNLLEEQGITAWVQNEVLGAAVGGLPPGMTTLPRVDVANHDAARARQLVDAFDRQLRVGPLPEDDAFFRHKNSLRCDPSARLDRLALLPRLRSAPQHPLSDLPRCGQRISAGRIQRGGADGRAR